MTDLQTMRAIVAKADNPDVEIQGYCTNQGWMDVDRSVEELLFFSEGGECIYRIKPQTITFNGRELPRPEILSDGVLSIKSFENGEICITGFMDRFNFKTTQDANLWINALNELMGEGK